MTSIVNLTPHTINVHVNGVEVLTIEPSGLVARVQMCTEEPGPACPLPDFITSRVVVDRVVGLPEPVDGVMYVVSLATATACLITYPGRTDLLVVGKPIKNADGKIVGCEGLTSIITLPFA